MRPSGKVNLIAVIILGAIAYGIWWVVTFSGVYLDNLEVQDAVVGAFNESTRKDDASTSGAIIHKCNLDTVGTHQEEDAEGVVKTVGGLGLKEENITVTRDEATKRIKIVVEYERRVVLRPLAKVKSVKFRVVKEGPSPPY